jgi:hypothetical protein
MWILALAAGCSFGAPACDVAPAAGPHGGPPLETARMVAAKDTHLGKLLRPRPSTEGFGTELSSPATRGLSKYGIGVQLPTTVNNAFDVGASNAAIRFEPFAAADGYPSRAAIADGSVVYANAFTDTDVVAATRGGEFELAYLLRSVDAPTSYSWRVTLPPSVAKVEARNSGLWFLDAHGDLLLHIPEPYVVDATGTRYPALMRWSDRDRAVSISFEPSPSEAAELQYPLLLDPTFETEVWIEVKAPPSALRHQAIYDEERKQAVLFGGSLADGETWVFDGATWRRSNPSRGRGAPATASAGAYDPIRKR